MGRSTKRDEIGGSRRHRLKGFLKELDDAAVRRDSVFFPLKVGIVCAFAMADGTWLEGSCEETPLQVDIEGGAYWS